MKTTEGSHLYSAIGIVRMIKIGRYLTYIMLLSLGAQFLSALIASAIHLNVHDSNVLARTWSIVTLSFIGVGALAFFGLTAIGWFLSYQLRKMRKYLLQSGVAGLATFQSHMLFLDSVVETSILVFFLPRIFAFELDFQGSKIFALDKDMLLLKTGDPVDILYDPKEPSTAIIKKRNTSS